MPASIWACTRCTITAASHVRGRCVAVLAPGLQEGARLCPDCNCNSHIQCILISQFLDMFKPKVRTAGPWRHRVRVVDQWPNRPWGMPPARVACLSFLPYEVSRGVISLVAAALRTPHPWRELRTPCLSPLNPLASGSSPLPAAICWLRRAPGRHSAAAHHRRQRAASLQSKGRHRQVRSFSECCLAYEAEMQS